MRSGEKEGGRVGEGFMIRRARVLCVAFQLARVDDNDNGVIVVSGRGREGRDARASQGVHRFSGVLDRLLVTCGPKQRMS